MKTMEDYKKKYDLVGIDGNAYAIMAYVRKAMRECGKSEEEITAYFDSAKSSDYSNLVYVSYVMIEKLNDENGYGNN